MQSKMNVYIHNDLQRRLHRHDILDIPTFVNEAVEKALDILNLKEKA